MKGGVGGKKARVRPFLSKRRVRVALAICVLLTAGLIFYFSSQDGETSTETSDEIVALIVDAFVKDYGDMSPSAQEKLWSSISFFVRKSAHFMEYTALGFFLRLFMRSLCLRFPGVFAWLCGALYAATDEFHQTFTSARAGMWQDVALDSGGVLFGCLVALAMTPLFLWAWRRWKTE